jgi:hypothetical protein
MTPIHELLNRILWDKEFGQGRFEIGFYDRREGTIPPEFGTCALGAESYTDNMRSKAISIGAQGVLRLTIIYLLTLLLGGGIAFGVAKLTGIWLQKASLPVILILSGGWFYVGWKYASAAIWRPRGS